MKGKIICKTNETGYGIHFLCSNCNKSIFVNTLCKKTECSRCGIKFKPIIKIERIKL